MSGLNRHRSGHVYFDLVDAEGDAGEARARLPVALFKANKLGVNALLKKAGGGLRMTDGLAVRIRADVELAGAKFIDEPVTVDGTLVTSRGWPDLPYFMPKFLEVLGKSSG